MKGIINYYCLKRFIMLRSVEITQHLSIVAKKIRTIYVSCGILNPKSFELYDLPSILIYNVLHQ